MISENLIDSHSENCNRVQKKVRELEMDKNNLNEINFKIDKLIKALNTNNIYINPHANIQQKQQDIQTQINIIEKSN